jgi:peptide/nickel transport system permease protein
VAEPPGAGALSTPEVAVETVRGGAVAPTTSPKFLRRLLRRPLALVCVGYLLTVCLTALMAPVLLPEVAGQRAGDLLSVRQGPSWEHVLGTDTLGRDVLERLLVGTRVTLIGVAQALAVVLALGVPLGLAAGYFGGWTDRMINWIAELKFSMPGIIIILVVLSVFPQSMTAGMVTFGVLAAPSLMRIVRSATLPVREELYIAAARVAGLSHAYIIRAHVLPRIGGPVIVQASLLSAGALLTQTGLAFLNLLVDPPAPSWGGMVADGASVIVLQPWLIWPPGLAIALTTLAFGLLGDAVSDATVEKWAPRISRSPGRRTPQPALERPSVPAGSAAPLISVEGLSVAFPAHDGPVRVVERVSFDVRSCETVALVGESGCGKTVTALSILGLVPGDGKVEAGSVLFEGRDLAASSEQELRRIRGRSIALISQEPMVSLNPVFRVGWQIAQTLRRHRGLSRREARRETIDLLRRVRLTDAEVVARRYPHELSGGMAQRVALARALAGEPKLLIADEPTTALDVSVQAEILELLRELQRERGMAILLVTHDWGVVADLCDRAVVMYAGQVVERAEVTPIFREPLHPYTEALLASNPTVASGDLPIIPGAVPKPGAWPAGCHFHPRCKYATTSCRERPIPLERPLPGRESRCIHYEQLLGTR